MTRRAARLLCLAALACLAGPARATDTEHREFSIFIDGKDAGMSRMTLIQEDDGTTYVSASGTVELQRLFARFKYTVDSQEWWKGGRLVGLKTTSTENGKRTDVTAAVSGEQLRVSVNGQESGVRPDVWTTSYWKLADTRFHNKPVPVLDVDTGKEYAAQLQFVATEQLKVGGQTQDCYRFRVTGAANTSDLWFDRYHRLVRQEFTESGHRVIMQLYNVRR